MLGSCTINDSSKVSTYNFTVRNSDWRWNSDLARYEYFFDFPELSYRAYESGIIAGAVFVIENGSETQKSLPYVQTYDSRFGAYTETVSFDTMYGGNNSIGFYLQASDLGKPLVATYDFKITLITGY